MKSDVENRVHERFPRAEAHVLHRINIYKELFQYESVSSRDNHIL